VIAWAAPSRVDNLASLRSKTWPGLDGILGIASSRASDGLGQASYRPRAPASGVRLTLYVTLFFGELRPRQGCEWDIGTALRRLTAGARTIGLGALESMQNALNITVRSVETARRRLAEPSENPIVCCSLQTATALQRGHRSSASIGTPAKPQPDAHDVVTLPAAAVPGTGRLPAPFGLHAPMQRNGASPSWSARAKTKCSSSTSSAGQIGAIAAGTYQFCEQMEACGWGSETSLSGRST
jgi:hypothetical protein